MIIYVAFYIIEGDYPLIQEAFLDEEKAKLYVNHKNEYDRFGDGRYYHYEKCELN